MKNILLYTVAFTTAILIQVSAVAQKNEKDRIEGSGRIITKDIPVKSFDELSASGIFNLQLSQGAIEQVKIEADDNLQDLFIVNDEGSKLEIRMKENANFKSKTKLNVYVTFKNLKSLDLTMVGGATSDEKLKFNDLKLKNQSVGSLYLEMTAKKFQMENESVGTVKLSGSADNVVIKNNSVGTVKAGDFIVQVMNVDNSGVGSVEVNAEKELQVTDSFLGKVKNKGNATVKRTNKVVI